MSIIDPVAVAADAGLRHVDPGRLPIIRRRCGRGFTFVGRDGRIVDGAARGRIEALAIPPAWEEVRVAADPRAHVQAVGTDDAGRTQYRYHPEFRAAADAQKFARLRPVGERLAVLRDVFAEHLATDGRSTRSGSGDGDLPVVGALVDRTLLRVGSERYAACNGTFGASTLRARHASEHDDGVRLRFTAKGDVERDLVVDDPALAAAILRRRRRARSSDERLFRGPDGGAVTGASLATRLSAWAGLEMTAKELRTWGATATMIGQLMEPDGEAASSDPVLAALDGVAARLGNTRAVARSAYVAPTAIEAFEDGSLAEAWSRSRTSTRFDRSEQTLRKLLGRRRPG